MPPSKVIEVQALIGDSTDNVPGVPGIGVKTAALLINEFGDLDTLLARASEIKQQKRRESLIHIRRPGAAVAHAGACSTATCRSTFRSPRPRCASPIPPRCSASCGSSNSARWSAASPMGSAWRRPKAPRLRPRRRRARRTTTIILCGAHRGARRRRPPPNRRQTAARRRSWPSSARANSKWWRSTARTTRR